MPMAPYPILQEEILFIGWPGIPSKEELRLQEICDGKFQVREDNIS